MTKREMERARLEVIRARQTRKPRAACPHDGADRDSDVLREAWLAGWDDEDARIREQHARRRA